MQVDFPKELLGRCYILQGGPENLRWWLEYEEYRDHQWFWSANKSVKKGDLAFIYLTAPLSKIVGHVTVSGEPFFHVGQTMFQNQHMSNKYCVEVGGPIYYGDQNDLSMSNLRKLFADDWPWVRYPRGNTKIPDNILPMFMELVRPLLPEIAITIELPLHGH